MSEEDRLRIVPLGGVGEIGKNMMALEYGEDMLLIDAGLMFPETDMLGIDIVIPDISYVTQQAERLRAIILTHGHEDHIGALPYVLSKVEAPVYGTKLTLGLAEVKLREHHLQDRVQMRTIQPRDVLTLGPFSVEFFHVCHSIPDTVGLAITTPVGLVVHSGDFKFDPHPMDGQLTDFAKLQELGERGVLLLLSDSTNAELPGFTPSEKRVGETLDRVFSAAPGRVIVATFASNVSRVQQVIGTAQRYGRRVGFVGRSMVKNMRMASQLGYLGIGPDELLTPEEMNGLPDERVVIVCTGSQGEPTSALARMAMGEERHITLRRGDTVILSAEPIPGNEELINHTIDNLFRAGADVHYHLLSDVHVSGHGSQEDQRLMLNLTRPRYFVPIHGEYRHLVLHSRLAQQSGIPDQNIFVVESGQALELSAEACRLGERVAASHVLVDGLGVGDVGHVVLRDRHQLARDGFLVAIVALDMDSGEILVEPEILSRGFVYMRDSERLIELAREQVWQALEHVGPRSAVSAKIKDALGELCYQQTGRRPIILPVVMEV
ncbi:MAG: ribonuclease J [Anaerolineae bacterium]|nr:ribonuclease J [Anaerolineae bacterium]